MTEQEDRTQRIGQALALHGADDYLMFVSRNKLTSLNLQLQAALRLLVKQASELTELREKKLETKK